MIGPFILKRLALICAMLLLILGGLGSICPVNAQSGTAQFDSTQSRYMDLGADFMRSIGNNLRKSDLFMSGADKLELAEARYGSTLGNDEPLILRAVFGKDRVQNNQDIYGIKKNHYLMVSLGDFVKSADLAITVNVKEGTASGWFIRQTQTFALDANKKEIIIAGKVQPVDPKDIELSGNDFLVSTEALEKWLGITFDYDLSALNLIVITREPFPVELAYARSQKSGNRYSNSTAAKLPNMEVPYGLLSQPYIDTNLSATIDHAPKQGPVKTEQWSTIFSGDIAGLNAKGYLSGSAQQPSERETSIDSARITLGKEDPDAGLLGPLNATQYSFGDVSSVSNSLIGGGQQEQGVYVSNRSLDNATSQTVTQIRGDSQPGWDVELYRNESYIDIRRVGTDGRYDFGNVDLIVGDNDFKMLFFGPQGESREEHKHVLVDSSLLSGNKGKYEFSATRNSLTTWQRVRPTTDQTGDPRISASYEQSVGTLGVANVGMTYNDDGSNAEQPGYRTFAQAGLASYFFDTFLNTDVGVDTGTGDYTTRVTARRNFGRQSLLLQYLLNSEGFNPGSAATGASVKDVYRFGLNGPISDQLWFFRRPNYSFNAGYSTTYSGSNNLTASGNLTAGVKSILFTAGLSYSKTSALGVGNNITNFSSNAADTSTTDFIFTARSPFFGGVLRTTTQYALKPETKFTQGEISYDRQINETLSSTTNLTYTPEPKIATLQTRLNWQTAYATISPNFKIDNNHNASAGVNINFGLGANPYDYKYDIYNAYLTDSGGVAARIFQDKNGSGIFDDGDELLPDVQLTALQGNQSAVSDEKGIAFIPNLNKNQRTDIVVNPSSSANGFGLSLFQGVSIRPHPGAVTKLEFPIVEGGEIDGQGYSMDSNDASQPARDMTVTLFSPDGKIEKTASTASDGYWSISTVRPGIYYLTAFSNQENPGYFIPRLLEFKPDGTTMFGQTVKLAKGMNTNFKFSATNSPPDGANHARVILPSDIASQKFQLSVGAYHSRLAMTLAWYKIKLYSGKIPGGLDLAMPMAGMPLDNKGIMSLVLNPGAVATMEQGAAACQAIGEMNVGDCSVNVITTYRTPTEEKIKPYRAPPAPLVAKAPEKEQEAPAAIAMTSPPVEPDVIVRPNRVQAETTATISPALAADLADYVAANPGMNRAALKEKTVLLNLGSYNSRALMAVIWYKVKTKYTPMIGDATLLVRPTDSNASSQTGKYTLRVSLPSYNIDDANNRCRLLTAQGQFCTVEVLPSGLQASR